ncbi:MAG: hypothetical protein WC465_04775 [Patescibacteria group bacterium]
MKIIAISLLALIGLSAGCGHNTVYYQPHLITMSPFQATQEELDARLPDVHFRHVTFYWAFDPQNVDSPAWASFTVTPESVDALIDSVAARHLNPSSQDRRLVGVRIAEPIMEDSDYGLKELGWVPTHVWHRN